MIMPDSENDLRVTYVGGPTALLEFGGLRLLTDPTFDPAGSEYSTPVYVLRKTQGPAVAFEALAPVDAVLLSHDHHFDNLDRAGRTVLDAARSVITTTAGAGRLGPGATGLAPWESREIAARDGRILRVTATPARHGPSDGDRGPVTGFALALTDAPDRVVYVTGDSVWFEGIADVARHFAPRVVVLFAGAARVKEVGPAHLTFTAAEAVLAARAFAQAAIVPLHFEGWAHFSESRGDIERTFAEAAMTERLSWPVAGRSIEIALS